MIIASLIKIFWIEIWKKAKFLYKVFLFPIILAINLIVIPFILFEFVVIDIYVALICVCTPDLSIKDFINTYWNG